MRLPEYLSDRGSQTLLAKALQCPSQLVWQWVRGVRPIPLDRCPAIERETGGAVTCEEQRPDVRWVRIHDPEWRWHVEGRPLLDVSAAQELARAA